MRHVSMATAAALLGLALGPAPSGAGDVKVSYDTQADFSRHQTWSWMKGTPFPSLVADKGLREAIESRLTAAGLERKDSGGDLRVAYHAAAESRIGVEKLGYKEPKFETEATRVTYVMVGTVLIDMIDGSSGKVVWRGQAQGIANPAPRDVELRINEAMGQLFEHFPPKP